MERHLPREGDGFDIVVNGSNRFLADLEVSAMASAGFYKESFPADTVQIRRRKDGTIRTVLSSARLEC